MAQLDEGARLCGRYTLIRRLGRGGMAEVWLAEDTSVGGRVALKCLLPEFATRPDMLRLLEQECRRVARLEHPHIVRVRAFHGDASPPCFAMDAIDGPDLRVARGRPPAELAALLAPIADALFKAHGLGLVHRDLKPSNVLLDGEGHAWLTDFGIAAALEAAPGELRVAGGGSDEFASPEQRAGLPPAVSDDAWGFGRLIQALLAPAERLGPLGQLASRLTAAAPAARPADFGAIRDQLRSMAGERAAGETLAVRRPAGLQPPGAKANRPAGRAGSAGARWAWGGLAGLLAVLAVVVFVLPEWVAERRAAAPPEARRQPAEPPAQETAADEIRRLVEARRAADAVRERLDAVLAGLEARAVERWAGPEFATLQAGVLAGAEAYERRDYGQAAETWEQALASGQALEAQRPGIVAQALADGARAIEAGQSRAATEAFGLAAAIDPGNPTAERGLERAAGLDEELAARAAAEARLQAETLRREAAIRRLEAEARTAEAGERWPDAVEAWRGALAEDGAFAPAVQGLARATARAELAGRIERFIADPLSLTVAETFEAAQATLAEARAAPAPATLLNARADALVGVLELVVMPVRVVLESDDKTDVVLHRVGRFGTFTRRDLELKPGRYTAVGSRPGYRDVRREFVVQPGRPMPGPVVIRSEEPI